MAARPGVRLHKLDRPILKRFKCAWLDYAPKLRNQDDGHLWDQLLRCVEGDIKKALASKLGAERLNLISSSPSIAVTNARMPTQNVGFRNIPRGVERCTQAATTKPTAQRITTQAEVLPSQVLSGQVEIEAQLAVSISPGVNHAGGNIAHSTVPHSTRTPASIDNWEAGGS